MKSIFVITGSLKTIDVGIEYTKESTRMFTHPVMAESADEAERLLRAHYEAKTEEGRCGSPYGPQYLVMSANVFEQIGELPVLNAA